MHRHRGLEHDVGSESEEGTNKGRKSFGTHKQAGGESCRPWRGSSWAGGGREGSGEHIQNEHIPETIVAHFFCKASTKHSFINGCLAW